MSCGLNGYGKWRSGISQSSSLSLTSLLLVSEQKTDGAGGQRRGLVVELTVISSL